MSAAQLLVNALDKAERESCSNASRPGSRFFPTSIVDQILQESDIRDILGSNPKIREDERNLFTSLTYKDARKIFGALCLDGNERFINEFLYRRLYDSGIPFSKEDLDFLDSNPKVQKCFLANQWKFIPVYLQKGKLHRELREKEILPFSSDKFEGRGSFGDVYKVEIYPDCHNLCIGTHEAIARKELKAAAESAEERDILAERTILELLRKICHPHIIELLASYKYRDAHNFIFPYASSNLVTFMQADIDMTPDEIYFSIYGVAHALEAIHEFTYQDETINLSLIGYHHDLRPANILRLGRKFVIADFGLSKLSSPSRTSKDRLKGGEDTYLAPEAFNEADWTNGTVGRALDIWSLGCILAELATVIEGFRVQDFQEARRDLRTQESCNIIDYTFHLNGELRPAVNQWLRKLEGSEEAPPKNTQTPELVELVRDMLNPSWRTRVKIKAVVERLAVLSFRAKAAEISSSFRSDDDDLHHLGRSSVFVLLEGIRFDAWVEAFRSLLHDSRESFHRRIGDTLSSMIELQDRLRTLHESIRSSPSDITFTSPHMQSVFQTLDQLAAQLPSHQRDDFEQAFTRNVADIDDIEILRDIKNAAVPHRYQSVGIKATMKYMSRAVLAAFRGPNEMMLPAGLVELDVAPTHISRFRDPLQQALNELRSAGDYEEVDKTRRVLIEWTKYDVRWNSAPSEKQFSQLNAKARFLSVQQTPRTNILQERVLDCLGFFHDEGGKRFGFIYAMPQREIPERTSPPGFYSLHQYIQDTSIIGGQKPYQRPYLGDVFQLAKSLASTLYALHEVGWLHKSISSHNILLFGPDKTKAFQCLSSGVLAGFVQSRPEESQHSVGGPAPSYDLYEHPAYRQQALNKTAPTEIAFKRVHDFYSLGVVLLELGLWCPIFDIHQAFKKHVEDTSSGTKGIDVEEASKAKTISLMEQFRKKLLNSYVPQLGERMGEAYMMAVRFCFEADIVMGFPNDDAKGRERCRQELEANVVKRLTHCSA